MAATPDSDATTTMMKLASVGDSPRGPATPPPEHARPTETKRPSRGHSEPARKISRDGPGEWCDVATPDAGYEGVVVCSTIFRPATSQIVPIALSARSVDQPGNTTRLPMTTPSATTQAQASTHQVAIREVSRGRPPSACGSRAKARAIMRSACPESPRSERESGSAGSGGGLARPHCPFSA